MVDGKIIEGTNGASGEFGHQPARGKSEGKLCGCGNKDCIEVHTSMSYLFKAISENLGLDCKLNGFQVKELLRAGEENKEVEDMLVKEIVQSNPNAKEIALSRYNEWLDNIANAFADVASGIDPKLMIMFGSILHLITEGEFEVLVRKVKERSFSKKAEIRKSTLGSMAGAIGAALLDS